jgi:S1-C subfamily serine protease
MVRITCVDKGSRADAAGIRALDNLISINGREICDVLDYRFFLAENNVTLKLARDGEEREVLIKKKQYKKTLVNLTHCKNSQMNIVKYL